MTIYGTIDADGVGEDGGAGGAGGPYANGSGVPGEGGDAGMAGYGTGGGIAGGNAGDGGSYAQSCGGLFCAGNEDGFNGGGGGAGGGSGGAYGGSGGAGGYGAFGSGFTNADGGDYGSGGAASTSYGTESGSDITWGSGGAGGGGGGGGYNYGSAGGQGGHGGGMVALIAENKLIMSGIIQCNGEAGGDGGNGGGESDDGGYDCSTSGYNQCGAICTESVYDAAGGAGGAAGGGSGGGILLQSDGTLNVTGTLEVRGGVGGNAGSPSSSYGTCFDNARGGAGGSGGRIKIMYNPCVTINITSTHNVSGGIGGNGVVSGNNGGTGTYRGDLISVSYIGLDAGNISLVDPVFCDYGDVPAISSTGLASGGIVGNYNYQWQYSTTDSISGFVNLPGEISNTCNPGLITLTTWYRRKVSSGSCVDYSNVVKASVIDCSAISEYSGSMQVQVFPNPNSGDFTISCNENLENDAVVKIFNAYGQKVFEQSNIAGQKTIQFNMNLSAGLYFLVLESGENRALTKITIQK